MWRVAFVLFLVVASFASILLFVSFLDRIEWIVLTMLMQGDLLTLMREVLRDLDTLFVQIDETAVVLRTF